MSVASDGSTPVVVNTLLAYTKHLMQSRDKAYITDAVCAKFSLDTIKQAREIILETCDPQQPRPAYQGPNGNKTVREKAVHAFEMIFIKLNHLDQAKSPTFACPSNELHLLIDHNAIASNDLKAMSERLRVLESSHAELKGTVTGMIANPIVSANQSTTPSLINSVFAPATRDRSDSVRSTKRNLSTGSDMEAEEASGDFTLPKRQLKNIDRKRRKLSASYSSVLKDGSPKPTSRNHQFSWGKSEDALVEGFSGVVPDVFIYHCSPGSNGDAIKLDLINKGLKIKNVELKSNENANLRSFRVSVETREDYDKLMSGVHIPMHVKFRKYIHFNHQRKVVNHSASGPKSSNSTFTSRSLRNHLAELDELGSAVVRTPVRHLIENILKVTTDQNSV